MKPMKSLLITALVGLLPLAAAADEAKSKQKEKPAPEAKRIEVCFVLDTTGSMSGLIAGAKEKIWSIANQMTDAKPLPDLKMGLIGYRDRGDAYVTQVHPLTDDLDAIYEHLMKFEAGGGGDGPESVNQALHEAVHKMDWSKDAAGDVLKIIFLVGDAPPHMDYEQDILYPSICQQAVRKDIIINAIQCGVNGETTPIWKEIARLSEGSYAAIEQGGGMVAIETPVDKEIAELTRAINETVIPYGDAKAQDFARSKVAAAASAPASRGAERAAYFSKGEGKAISGSEDLVAELEGEKVSFAEIKKTDLPEELRKLSKEELESYVGEQQAKRSALQEKMAALVQQRDAFVKKEIAKKAGGGAKAGGFDGKVREMVRRQGSAKGIEYKKD
jgi:uncharacterized protein YegL